LTARTSPPFRADHVGSLLRPPELAVARAHLAAGEISAERLREAEDAAIAAAVEMQEGLGLALATDGELRRQSWHMDFIFQLGGVSRVAEGQTVEFHRLDGERIVSAQGALRVDGPVSLEHTIFGDDFATLRSLTRAETTPKLTVPSVNMIYARGGRAAIDEAVYPDLDEFWSDVVAAYGEELRRLGELGCTYVQFDDTSFAMFGDPEARERIARRGDDPGRLHLTFIDRLNEVIAQRPHGMAVTTHTCRGNFRSSYSAAGGYDYIAEPLFSELAVDGFFVEYDDERSGGFEPLRFVPPARMVVLGLVTTKRGELEAKDEIKRRIEQASRHVPIEQICLSPQCGFASTMEGNDLSHEQQVAKLRLVVEVAEEIWGDAGVAAARDPR
jgi:5-methyltetrahydropteroyltriglutamate--homocysteine methyltransferase